MPRFNSSIANSWSFHWLSIACNIRVRSSGASRLAPMVANRIHHFLAVEMVFVVLIAAPAWTSRVSPKARSTAMVFVVLIAAPAWTP